MEYGATKKPYIFLKNLHKTELDFEQKGLLYVALSASYVITHSNFAKLTGGDIQILYF